MVTVLSRLSPSDVRTEPFPHVVVENCLPDELYQRLASEYPDDATILRYSRASDEEKAAQNARHDLSACELMLNPGCVSPVWDEFVRAHVSQAFFAQLVDVFGDEIRRNFPQLEQRLGKPIEDFRSGVRFHPDLDVGEVSLDCQIGINTPSTKSSSVRRVHTDATEELFAGLLYFRRPDDQSEGGDLEIFRWADPGKKRFLGEAAMASDVRLADVVRYRPNTLVLFLNTQDALHAVSTRSPSPVSRRLVNIVGRMYRSVPEGLFEKPQGSLLLKVRERLKAAMAGHA